ncbi:MAG TPA: NAD(P)-dependent oxidoreductase [Conexibacter sp.]
MSASTSPSSAPVVVGWIGLGEMGLPMAANLVAAGHDVVGYDLDAARVAAAERSGVQPAASIADVVARAGLLVTMLRTGAQTEQLLLGDGGIADQLASRADAADAVPAGGALDVIVMSTLDPPAMERLARDAAARGMTVLDVPVSGGVRGAEAATLSIMASGPRPALDRAQPLLAVLGADVHRLGDLAGMSQAAKLANQVMMAVAIAGTQEALQLASDYGMDQAPVIDAVLGGTGASWPLAHWPWMRSLWEEYEPDNALDILDKDLKAVMRAIAERGAQLPVTEAAFTRLSTLWADARAAAAQRREDA